MNSSFSSNKSPRVSRVDQPRVSRVTPPSFGQHLGTQALRMSPVKKSSTFSISDWKLNSYSGISIPSLICEQAGDISNQNSEFPLPHTKTNQGMLHCADSIIEGSNEDIDGNLCQGGRQKINEIKATRKTSSIKGPRKVGIGVPPFKGVDQNNLEFEKKENDSRPKELSVLVYRQNTPMNFADRISLA